MERDKKEQETTYDFNRKNSIMSARGVFGVVLGLLLVAGVTITLLSASNLTNLFLQEYVLGIDECDHTQESVVAENVETRDSCERKYAVKKKRDIAEGVAFLLFSIPLSYLSYSRLRKLIIT